MWEDWFRLGGGTRGAGCPSGGSGGGGSEKERRAEAEELGATGELGAGEELPLFLPTPSFMASADKD